MENKYYNKGNEKNAIYQYIEDNNLDNFDYVDDTMWSLIYANKEDHEAKVLVFLSQVSSKDFYRRNFTDEEECSGRHFEDLAKEAGIPFIFVRFIDDEKKFEYADCTTSMSEPFKRTPAIDLEKKFKEEYGLNVTHSNCKKEINDKASNKYQFWQQKTLGNDIIVTDIDLLRLNQGKVCGILELKRSYMSFEKWNPFDAENNNFIVLSKIAQYADIDFNIVYNRRQKEPVFIDDISTLKIYDFDSSREKPWYDHIATESIEDFVDNNKTATFSHKPGKIEDKKIDLDKLLKSFDETPKPAAGIITTFSEDIGLDI